MSGFLRKRGLLLHSICARVSERSGPAWPNSVLFSELETVIAFINSDCSMSEASMLLCLLSTNCLKVQLLL